MDPRVEPTIPMLLAATVAATGCATHTGVLVPRGPARAIPAEGLVLRLSFDEGQGTTIADAVTGTTVGQIITKPPREGHGYRWTEGRFRGGLAFDGEGAEQRNSFVNDYGPRVEIPDRPELNPTDALTVAAWIKPHRWPGANRRVLDKHGQYSLNGEGEFRFVVHGVGRVATGYPSLDTWHHVAGVYDGATLRMYVDGVLARTAPAAGKAIVTHRPLFVGARVGHDVFDGVLDEVLVYRRALSDAEVQALALP